MSAYYYYYCNIDKLESFSVATCGGANKLVGIGRGATARLLARLLEAPPEGARRSFCWAGDRIAIIADDHPVLRTIGLPADFLVHNESYRLTKPLNRSPNRCNGLQIKDFSGERLKLGSKSGPDPEHLSRSGWERWQGVFWTDSLPQ